MINFKLIDPQNKNVRKEDLRFYLFSSHLYLLCLVLHIALFVMFYLIEVHLMAVFNIFSCILFITTLIINKRGMLNLAYHLAIFEITVHAALATICLGWESNFCFYSVAICSVIMFTTFLKLYVKLIEVTLSTSLYLIAFFYITKNPLLYNANILVVNTIGFINIIVIISLLTSIFYKFYLETSILNKKLKIAAETDGLTGAYNRRFFNEYLEIEVNRLVSEHNFNTESKNQKNFAIAIIDIDDFKKINDTYGHLTGDNVLVQVVEIVKGSIFSRDIVCRYGGEEFVILFTRISRDGAIAAAEKILKIVEQHDFIFNDSNKNGRVTISIGFAYFDDYDEGSVQSILEIADKRLYVAKASGKNRVIYE